jgi:Dolichyl-phosphate-mannose-protein mannosyltransferase
VSRKRQTKKKQSPLPTNRAGDPALQSFLNGSFRRPPVLITLSALIGVTTVLNLHSPWTPLAWSVGIVVWGYYFWSDRVEPDLSIPKSTSFPKGQFLFVLTAATVLRLYKLTELPLGPYVDEVLTLNNSLGLLDRPFDLFGQTPLLWQGWVETANLYLYFDLLILKLFGVSYWGMKLLSVIPGIIACGAVFLICQLLFDRRVAVWIALLFTFAHWPVRLSRYGWDASFMVMAFAIAIWLLLLAMQRGRPLYAYFSGMTAGLCLYSYLGSRICLLSLLGFLALEGILRRSRWVFRQGTAFATGAAMAAYPLLIYYLFMPGAFWVRAAELSVFNSAYPPLVILDNIWRHALMFFTRGGTYARDNYPGLAMIDPLTALLFIAGWVPLIRNRNAPFAWLIGCTFALNLIPGVFSVSQEGAPYVYRTAAVMIPAFLIVGLGLQRSMQQLESRLKRDVSGWKVQAITGSALLLAIILNLYLYFGLEPTNNAAMRVMLYDLRLIGLEIAREEVPVILVGRDVLDQVEVTPRPGEKYGYANPPVSFPEAVRKLAVVNFSGRYDPARSVADNFKEPKDIYLVDPVSLGGSNLPIRRGAKIIFKSGDEKTRETVSKLYPHASVREIRNIYGEPLLTVATLPAVPTTAPLASTVAHEPSR